MPNGNEITSIALMGVYDDEFFRYSSDEEFVLDKTIVIDGEAIEDVYLSDTEKDYNNSRKDLVKKLLDYSHESGSPDSLPDFRKIPVSDVLVLVEHYRNLCMERAQPNSNYDGYQLRLASIDDALSSYNNLSEDQKHSVTLNSMSREQGKATLLRIVYKALGEEIIQRREIIHSPKVDVNDKYPLIDQLAKLSLWLEETKYERSIEKDSHISLARTMSRRYSSGPNEQFVRRPMAFESGVPEEIPPRKRILIRRKRPATH